MIMPRQMTDPAAIEDGFDRLERPLQRGADLHPLIGRLRVGAAGVRAAGHRPRPSARTRVPKAGTVCVNRGSQSGRSYRRPLFCQCELLQW